MWLPVMKIDMHQVFTPVSLLLKLFHIHLLVSSSSLTPEAGTAIL